MCFVVFLSKGCEKKHRHNQLQKLQDGMVNNSSENITHVVYGHIHVVLLLKCLRDWPEQTV